MQALRGRADIRSSVATRVKRERFLDRIASGVIETGRATRTVVEVPPYLGFLDPDCAVPWMSLAAPSSPITDRRGAFDALGELRDRFDANSRRVRFELFDAIHADHIEIVSAAGFKISGEQPMLACTNPLFISVSRRSKNVPSYEARFLGTSEPIAVFNDFARAVRASFGTAADAVSVVDEAAALHRDTVRGRITCATAFDDGKLVGAATLVGVGSTVELAGVGTVPEARGRGVATLLCANLVGRFFECGGRLVWLSVEDEIAEALYRNLGFRRIGARQLNFEEPPATP